MTSHNSISDKHQIASIPSPDQMLDALRTHFGFDRFRPLQQEIVTGLLEGRNSFVLMPTGGGKSLCYQLPALLMPGLTVVVSPLIALMKDQVDSLREAGIPATFINSTLDGMEIDRRRRAVLDGETKLLYVAPERLLTPSFLSLLDKVDLSLIAIDEAHCISEWGHDFRQEYRQLATIRDRYPETPVVAMTATANARVREDILAQLHFDDDARVYVAGFDRANLQYSVQHRKKSAFAQITEVVERHRGESGIIYCLSRAETEKVAARLVKKGYSALPYHAGLERGVRDRNQEAFERDEVDIICATIAFGMGIDKPDVRFVIHHSLPKNIMSYYQETGRAGRDGLPGECLLLYAPGDRARLLHFIQQMGDQGEQRVAMKHLGEMTAYAETGECRRKILLKHFGEEYPEEGCGNCDNCLNPERLEEFDATERAQMLMSTIVRLRESFGMGYVIDVLRGSENRKIQNNRHTELSTHGIGKDWSKKEWSWLGNALLTAGHIHQRVEAYNVLQVAPSGWEILNGKEKLVLKRAIEQKEERVRRERGTRRTAAEVALPELTPLHQKLYDRLRGLRKELADERGIAPYMIFGDRTLHEMAAYLPQEKGELLAIHGIGAQKAEYYGPLFIKEIIRFDGGYGPLEKLDTASAAPRAAGPPITRPSGYDPIDVDDLGETVIETGELFAEGLDPAQIAERRGLATSTIEGHLSKLIMAGEIKSLDRLVPSEKIEEIRRGLREVNEPFLRSVLEYLGEENYTFFEIRAVRTFDERYREE